MVSEFQNKLHELENDSKKLFFKQNPSVASINPTLFPKSVANVNERTARTSIFIYDIKM